LKIINYISMENVNNVENSKCHDCGVLMDMENGKIKNGYHLLYKENEEETKVFKCKGCYEKNPSLSNFRPCEVYSRVVGYLRPVGQWNLGKKEEYSERKEYLCKGE